MTPPSARTAMLIRRPVAEVFEEFVDPGVTTKFWFTGSSGRLETGREVQWEWEMYGLSVPVLAREVDPNRRIVIEWPGEGGPNSVEWLFEPRGDGATFVSISESGYTVTGDALVSQVGDSTGGFSFVLAGLKAWLEHGIRLELVRDRHPDGFGG